MINVGPNGQIMLTYRCSAACRHCLVMAAPDQDAPLVTVEDATRYAVEYGQLGRRLSRSVCPGMSRATGPIPGRATGAT